MSALEQFSNSPFERRGAPRLRVPETIVVYLGRSEGTLVDVNEQGARVRHATAVGRGTSVRIAFTWHRRHFSAAARVLSSRIVALDGPTYESRVQFVDVDRVSVDTMRELMATIENTDLRRAVENLRGMISGTAAAGFTVQAHGFFRCRYFAGGQWEKKWTRDPMQPDQGFTLPATLSDFELAQVCRSYERIDADARQLLRTIAEQIIQERGSARTADR